MDRRRRTPARLLAPLALVAFVLALLFVVASSDTPDDSNDSGDRSSQRDQRTNAGGDDGDGTTTDSGGGTPTQTFYTVKTGDTLAGIADANGVTVEDLQTLNPDLDPQALVSGQKIRLKE